MSRASTLENVEGGAGERPKRKNLTNRRRVLICIFLSVAVGALAWGVWLAGSAAQIKSQLDSATSLIPTLETSFVQNSAAEAELAVKKMSVHTRAAKEVVDEPLWSMAGYIPFVGENFSAVTEVTRSAHDVVNLGLVPLAQVMDTFNLENFLPSSSGTDLEPLVGAAPLVSSAAYAVSESAERLDGIDTSSLLPQVTEPLVAARERLHRITDLLNGARDAALLAPGMLGADGPREYLLMVQNNAEVRASGGIPGALAVLRLDDGRLTLEAQTSATDLGPMVPPIPVEREQEQIYTRRAGTFMQDVNLTPDFPTSAGLAQAMWERKTGQQLDGVLSLDPIALSYILDVTGPVNLSQPDIVALGRTGLPTQLTGRNVVQTLLSDVYSKIERPTLQDAYFAGVAQEIFAALSDSKADAKGLVKGLARGAEEGRVHIWSGRPNEQSIIEGHRVSGAISGQSVAPAEFGVYFNDGTGAKMDYYVKRTVQFVKQCAHDDYEEVTVRVTSINTAPLDAASTLSPHVTGNGVYGVPAGVVQTNITAYGPVQAYVETAKLEGVRAGFASYLHSSRPVGVVAVRLNPGESKTVEFAFGKIVQHTEPNLVVTPTIQSVKDVSLPTVGASCSQ